MERLCRFFAVICLSHWLLSGAEPMYKGTIQDEVKCPIYGSQIWRRMELEMKCRNGLVFHCAKELKSNKFIKVCAVEKHCLLGEEPRLDYNDWDYQFEAYCRKCDDVNRLYNPVDDKLSSTMSQCPEEKLDCTNEGVLECPFDDPQEKYYRNRMCRCDARRNYLPGCFPFCSNISNYYCTSSFEATHCYKRKSCPEGEERSIKNFTCIKRCDEGNFRPNDSDDCIPDPNYTSSTPMPHSVLSASTSGLTSASTSSTSSPTTITSYSLSFFKILTSSPQRESTTDTGVTTAPQQVDILLILDAGTRTAFNTGIMVIQDMDFITGSSVTALSTDREDPLIKNQLAPFAKDVKADLSRKRFYSEMTRRLELSKITTLYNGHFNNEEPTHTVAEVCVILTTHRHIEGDTALLERLRKKKTYVVAIGFQKQAFSAVWASLAANAQHVMELKSAANNDAFIKEIQILVSKDTHHGCDTDRFRQYGYKLCSDKCVNVCFRDVLARPCVDNCQYYKHINTRELETNSRKIIVISVLVGIAAVVIILLILFAVRLTYQKEPSLGKRNGTASILEDIEAVTYLVHDRDDKNESEHGDADDSHGSEHDVNADAGPMHNVHTTVPETELKAASAVGYTEDPADPVDLPLPAFVEPNKVDSKS